MANKHTAAKNILTDVPIDETELVDLKGQLVEHPTVACSHESDVEECPECYDPNRKVQIELSFEYNTNTEYVHCELIFETTCQAMINTITMKETCGEAEKYMCGGNTFSHQDDYYWCLEHQGEYNELKVSQIMVNSDYDTGLIPLLLLKTGDTSLTLQEVKFDSYY